MTPREAEAAERFMRALVPSAVAPWRAERSCPAASALIDSPLVAVSQDRSNYVIATFRACAQELRLPPALDFAWRAGGPGCARGATAYNHDTGELCLYFSAAEPLLRLRPVVRHEAYHAAALLGGRSRRITVAEEEQEADDYAHGLLDIPSELRR